MVGKRGEVAHRSCCGVKASVRSEISTVVRSEEILRRRLEEEKPTQPEGVGWDLSFALHLPFLRGWRIYSGICAQPSGADTSGARVVLFVAISWCRMISSVKLRSRVKAGMYFHPSTLLYPHSRPPATPQHYAHIAHTQTRSSLLVSRDRTEIHFVLQLIPESQEVQMDQMLQ